ncbi:MAG: hypothetical protein IJM76_02430 [Lachnospiraceae bacterium]|nr:hypothetical protein [Lachnospiraceae bacterium]
MRTRLGTAAGFSTIEVILLLLILIMLVLIFKNQILGLADTIFKQITKSAKDVY